MQKRKRLGDILVESGAISEQQLILALESQKRLNKKLGETLVQEGIISEEAMLKVLEIQLKIPYVNLSDIQIDKKVANMISEQVA